MKAVFVHDHRFIVDESGAIFSPGKLPYAVFERYLKVFDELVVIGRARQGETIARGSLNRADGKGTSFEFLPGISNPIDFLKNIRPVRRRLAYHIQSADALISRTSMFGYLAASQAMKFNKPCAVEVVGCAWDAVWNYGTLNGKISAPVTYLWQKRVLNKTPFAIYVTRKFLQKRYPCAGYTAGVSDVNIPPIIESTVSNRLIRTRNPGKPFIFGLIGSLHSKWKGVQTAIGALGQIAEGLPAFELRILGDGDQARWKKMAETHGIGEQVRFMGTLPSGDRVLEWLDDVDVYLQPSLQEGLPRSLVEAMSRGCPAVASTAGGIPELLDDRFLHQPNDANGLSELILTSLDGEWREKQAKRNIEVASRYTEDVLELERDKFWSAFAEHVRGVV